MLLFGLSYLIIVAITGTDTVARTANFMEQDENLEKISESYEKIWPVLAILDRIWIAVMTVITLMSLKWHWLSEALFYFAAIYACNCALIDIPETTKWTDDPNTRFCFLIFSAIDRAVP